VLAVLNSTVFYTLVNNMSFKAHNLILFKTNTPLQLTHVEEIHTSINPEIGTHITYHTGDSVLVVCFKQLKPETPNRG
jgi:hypothetical protein